MSTPFDRDYIKETVEGPTQLPKTEGEIFYCTSDKTLYKAELDQLGILTWQVLATFDREYINTLQGLSVPTLSISAVRGRAALKARDLLTRLGEAGLVEAFAEMTVLNEQLKNQLDRINRVLVHEASNSAKLLADA